MSVKRIAMWSGPRNLSTALMRSFASRADCSVIDEPFYAAYLKESGIDHPMKTLILKTYNNDPIEVATNCLKSKVNKKIQYQKHMTHHMLDTFDCSFVHLVSNAFLIRSPEKVVKSFGKKIKEFEFRELGYIQQLRLFDMICDKVGSNPPVIDADDLCAKPELFLKKLCKKLGISYTERMLSWRPGPHSYDGIWGSYWYHSVNQSSNFVLPKETVTKKSKFQRDLVEQATPLFERINQYKITI